ncbi:MAG TPA: hypothetical protein VF450_15370 [Noviherbaspirillum sp.]
MNKNVFFHRTFVKFGLKAMDLYLRNFVREAYIAHKQRQYMRGADVGRCRRAIIFLVHSRNSVSGGIMSNIALARETERLRSLHGADVFVCSYLGNPPLLKYTKFPNDRTILNFQALVRRFVPGTEILVHIPEWFVPMFVEREKGLLHTLGHRCRVNILLQNIEMAPTRQQVTALEKIGKVTATTAHRAYSGKRTEERLGCPVHYLTAWTSTFPYEKRPFAARKNIIVVSPDAHSEKTEILSAIKSRLPEFRFVIVKGLKYVEYRSLVASAKFSLTFGEGLDAYFSEMILSGGVGAAVYNDRFFTPDFASLPFVYSGWDEAVSRFPKDVRAANNAEEMERINRIAHQVLDRYASLELLQNNLATYYSTYFPAHASGVAV